MNTPNLPDHLQGYATPDITDRLAGNLGMGAPPYVSIMGNRFTLVDSAGEQEAVTTVDPKTGIPYLDCCIADVGDHASKVYYGKAYEPGSSDPPLCWSDNGVAPSTMASIPQARSCTPDPTNEHGCKWAVWGSATSKVSGKGVPACAKQQKLALVIPGDAVTFLLRVPPNSLDNLKAYNLRFKGQPFSIRDVVTRISFEAGVLGTLTFQAIGYIDQALLVQRQAVLAAKKTDDLVGRGDKPIGALPAGGQVTAALPPPAQTAAAQTGFIPAANTIAPAGAIPNMGGPAHSSGEPPARKKRGRPAATEAQPAPGTVQQAPFRPSEPPAQAQPAGNAQAAPFGMAEGVAPNADLQASINSVFGP